MQVDELIEKQDAEAGKRKVTARRVDLGRTHNRIPKVTPYPFMVSEEWKVTYVDGKQLDRPFRTRAEDPVGYGKKKGMIGQAAEFSKF